MIVEDNPDSKVYEKLRDAILSLLPADCPTVNRVSSPFAILEKDGAGIIQAGVYAWVHPGSALMAAARGFYQKHGYRKFTVLEDFILGHKRYGFMKLLSKEGAM